MFQKWLKWRQFQKDHEDEVFLQMNNLFNFYNMIRALELNLQTSEVQWV